MSGYSSGGIYPGVIKVAVLNWVLALLLSAYAEPQSETL